MSSKDRGPSPGPRPVERSVEMTPRPARTIPVVGTPDPDRVTSTDDMMAVAAYMGSLTP